jgi:putative FmdB family regulatory protein
MPFYEYQCQRCGHHLEAMQKLSDAPLKKCPACGKPTLTRLMSAPVFRLKGGGWYETDFKSDGEGKRNLADQPEADAAKDDKKAPAAQEAAAKEPASTKEAGAKEAAPKDAAPAKDAKKPEPAPTASRSASKTARKADKAVKKSSGRR